MKLSREEVLQIASLARLELTEEEIQNYGDQLSDILAHFESLQSVDTSTATETSSTLKEQLPFREDQPALFPAIQSILNNANEIIDNQFVVPAIFEPHQTLETDPKQDPTTDSQGSAS
jgi:aspartyl-tRNA(Asn)/glutamyl-tRNA(Gln) amidotransferase subunit C